MYKSDLNEGSSHHGEYIYLNANAGTQLLSSSKAELIKYLDVPNSHNLDEKSKYAASKYQKLKQMTCYLLQQREAIYLMPIFTGSGTEANCLAIKSVIYYYSCQTCELPEVLHIVTTAYEHKSVVKCLETLSHDQSPYKKKVEVTAVKPRVNGYIDVYDVVKSLQPNTVMVSVMAVNNELGSDNRETLVRIGQHLARTRDQQPLAIFFHSDCVYAFGKYYVPFEAAGLDMVSVSYYKAFGPNRIGSLVVAEKTSDLVLRHPLINSSLLESENTHGGTQSMALVASALNSLKVISINRFNKNNRLRKLRDFLENSLYTHFAFAEYHAISNNWQELLKDDGSWLVVSFSPTAFSLPNTFMFTLIRKHQNKLDAPCGNKLLQFFALQGIVLATGSACNQNPNDSLASGNSSLAALDVPHKLQQCALRVSFCDTTLKHELLLFVNTLVHYLEHVYV